LETQTSWKPGLRTSCQLVRKFFGLPTSWQPGFTTSFQLVRRVGCGLYLGARCSTVHTNHRSWQLLYLENTKNYEWTAWKGEADDNRTAGMRQSNK